MDILCTEQVVAPTVEFNVQTYDDGCIRVIREAEPKITATISVTSPTVRHLQSEDDKTGLPFDLVNFVVKFSSFILIIYFILHG